MPSRVGNNKNIHNITISTPNNQHLTKYFALSTKASSKGIPEVMNEPTANIEHTDSGCESSDNFPSKLSAFFNYFTGTSSTKPENLVVLDNIMENTTNRIHDKSKSDNKSHDNITATDAEFNAVINEKQNEKTPSFDESTIHHTNNNDRHLKLQTIHNFVNQSNID